MDREKPRPQLFNRRSIIKGLLISAPVITFAILFTEHDRREEKSRAKSTQLLLDEFNKITDYEHRNHNLGYQGSFRTISELYILAQYMDKTTIAILPGGNPLQGTVYEIKNSEVTKKDDRGETKLKNRDIINLKQKFQQDFDSRVEKHRRRKQA